jgi:cytochrome b6-f complex iron-sulfur subunit
VVLKSIGAGCLAGACGGGGGGPSEGTATICGTDACISIAENPELADVGGALLFQVPGHRIYVARTASGFSAVTAICTHAQCVIEWDQGASRYECPCHGSQFAADGSVLKAPAIRALRLYMTELVGDTLTVKLT